jgi:hypothetical protein
MLKEEKECTSTTFLASSSSSNSVDVIIWIIGRVKLDNPVNFGEVKTSLSNISAK